MQIYEIFIKYSVKIKYKWIKTFDKVHIYAYNCLVS